MTKVDIDHPNFVGRVLCTKGIGAGYVNREDAKNHKYTKGKTIEYYRLRNGAKINLPIYYRNQLFSEKEREMLFLDKIEKGVIYVMGQKVHRDDEAEYLGLLEEARKTEQSHLLHFLPLQHLHVNQMQYHRNPIPMRSHCYINPPQYTNKYHIRYIYAFRPLQFQRK